MVLRKFGLASFVLLAAVLGGPLLGSASAEAVYAASANRASWYIEVSLIRHGDRVSQTAGPYSSKANAQAAYKRWAATLESGASPRLERIYVGR